MINSRVSVRRGVPVQRMRRSDLRLAAVDEELDAIDVAGVVGGKESRGACDLLGLGDAAERNGGGERVEECLLVVGLGDSEQARRPGRAGAQDVDADGA